MGQPPTLTRLGWVKGPIYIIRLLESSDHSSDDANGGIRYIYVRVIGLTQPDPPKIPI